MTIHAHTKFQSRTNIRFLHICRVVIFLSNFEIINNEFHVNNSAHAIITSISHSEKVTQLINFIIPNGTTPFNHEILVIENTAQNAINIHANILDIIVFHVLLFVFCCQTSLALSVISNGVNDVISLFSNIKIIIFVLVN